MAQGTYAKVLILLSILSWTNAKAIFKNFSPPRGAEVTLPSNGQVTFSVSAYDNKVSVTQVKIEIRKNGQKVATKTMNRVGSSTVYRYVYNGLDDGSEYCYRIWQRNSKKKSKWSNLVCFDVFDASTIAPTPSPSAPPTNSLAPSSAPTAVPSAQPSVSLAPTGAPSDSASPSSAPSSAPTSPPSLEPSASPTTSVSPTTEPTPSPTSAPTAQPVAVTRNIKTGLQPDCNVKNRNKFSICLDLSFDGVSAKDYGGYFLDARDLWENVIHSNGIYFTNTNALKKKYTATGSYPKVIDGVYIASSIKPIDGEWGILGYAGPVYVVGSGGKTKALTGQMVFDKDDLDWMEGNGLFQGVVEHEMGHVLGIGTLWKTNSLVDYPDSNLYFGSNVKKYWKSQGCSLVEGGAPIIEMDGGSGTAGGHFDERCFDEELMTGYVDDGMVMSRLTLGTLADLGYGVDFSLAEDYTIQKNCCTRRLGETFSSRSSPRRRLSAEKEKKAVEFGKGTLKKLKKFGYLTSEDGVDITEGITVYVEEDGHIVDVEVTLSDTDGIIV